MLPMALLLASKNIYEEASRVLFSGNTFVLPTWRFMTKFFAAFDGKSQLACMTKLELAFTASDLPSGLPESARTARPDELLHDTVKIWSQKARLVLSSTRCRAIMIRMDDEQCLQKHCRLDKNAVWTLVIPRDPRRRPDDHQPVSPRKVQIRGLPDRVSLQRVLKDIGGYREVDTSAHS